MKRVQRESNIELCRIFSMVLIISHHCIYHGNAINMEYCTNKLIALALLPGGKLCFDTFIAISMWFLVDSSFKAVRFVKLWTEVLFYSVLTTIAALLLGAKLPTNIFIFSFQFVLIFCIFLVSTAYSYTFI